MVWRKTNPLTEQLETIAKIVGKAGKAFVADARPRKPRSAAKP